MDVVVNNIPLICTLVGIVGVLYSIIIAGIVKSAPAGDERMNEIARMLSGKITDISLRHAKELIESAA